jgi:predicted class III extradiol MEMO1 family dioxygenase
MLRLSGSSIIHPPAVAGQFYPADPDRLRSEVVQLLAAAPKRR